MTTTLDPTLTDEQGTPISLEASDVTGMRTLPVEVQRELSADAVARSIANLMALPQNVPWALRENSSSAYLDGGTAIGDQVAPGAKVTVTPKTHLG